MIFVSNFDFLHKSLQARILTALISSIVLLSSISFSYFASPVFAIICPPEAPDCNIVPTTNNPASIGTIQNSNLPSIPSGGENSFVAGIVRNGIQLLLIISFIVAFIWMILAGWQFIFAGGDSKNISTAWSRIYWGLIGMAVIMASFAIIKIVETFFGIDILSGGLSLPRI